MFQSVYQNGASVDLFDAKVNLDKDKNAANLFKIHNIATVQRTYDKLTKGYVYTLSGMQKNSKISFPKEDKNELGLVQPFLIFQIFLSNGLPFSFEISISDASKTRRRLYFSSAYGIVEENMFHMKIPIESIKKDIWLNLCVDVKSFMEAFKGQVFRSIDQISLSSNCKLKKIFTMKSPILENNIELESPETEENDMMLQTVYENMQSIPKSQNFQSNVEYRNQILSYTTVRRTTTMTPLTLQMNTTTTSSDGLEESGISTKADLKSPNNSRLLKKFSSKRFSKKTMSVERTEGSSGKRSPSLEGKSVEREGNLKLVKDKVKSQKFIGGGNEDGSPRANTAPKNVRNAARSPLSNKLSPKPLSGSKPGSVQSNVRLNNSKEEKSETSSTAANSNTNSAPQLIEKNQKKKPSVKNPIMPGERKKTPLDLKKEASVSNNTPTRSPNTPENVNLMKSAPLKVETKKVIPKPTGKSIAKKNSLEADAGKKKISSSNSKKDQQNIPEETYYELSKKFNTISDPQIFSNLRSTLHGSQGKPEEKNNSAIVKRETDKSTVKGDDEIEENIELENQSFKAGNATEKKNFESSSFPAFESKHGNKPPEESGTLVESVFVANVKDYDKKTEENKKNAIDDVILNASSVQSTPQRQSGKYMNTFYEQHLNKYINNLDDRPFTPPFNGLNSGVMIITKKNNSTVAIIPEGNENLEKKGENSSEIEKNNKEIELVYDKILDCYYDPETNTYYKNN